MPLLERLKDGLVVSCQPVDHGPLDRPDFVAAMARAAVSAGAAGLRIEGIENVKSVRAVTSVPIIGIVKRDLGWTPVRITTSCDDVRALIAVGADVVGYDSTSRPRPDSREKILNCILDEGALAMADCATLQDGIEALFGGANIIGTTLSGYTDDTISKGCEPDLELVSAFKKLGGFVMAEGRYNSPNLAAEAIKYGADCVTVGSAITRLEHITGWYREAISNACGK